MCDVVMCDVVMCVCVGEFRDTQGSQLTTMHSNCQNIDIEIFNGFLLP